MYAVNGFPSTRTSTRRWSSCGTTSTRGSLCVPPLRMAERGSGGEDPGASTPRLTSSQALRMLSAHHHVALGIVEHHLPAAVHRGDRHAQRDRVAVARVDARVRLLAAAHALHPVPDVGGGGRIGAGVRGGLRGRHLRQLHRGQLIGLHPHLRREPLVQAAGGRDLVGVEVQHAGDRKSTRLNSSHMSISYAVFCLKKKKNESYPHTLRKNKKINKIETKL